MFPLFPIRTTTSRDKGKSERHKEREKGSVISEASERMVAHDATAEEYHRSFQDVERIKRRVFKHNGPISNETLRCNRSGTPCVLEKRRS